MERLHQSLLFGLHFCLSPDPHLKTLPSGMDAASKSATQDLDLFAVFRSASPLGAELTHLARERNRLSTNWQWRATSWDPGEPLAEGDRSLDRDQFHKERSKHRDVAEHPA